MGTAEPVEAAAKTSEEATRMGDKVKGIISAQNRVLADKDVLRELKARELANERPQESPVEQRRLGQELRALLLDLQAAESEWVEARSVRGDKIDEYRRLLRSCSLAPSTKRS